MQQHNWRSAWLACLAIVKGQTLKRHRTVGNLAHAPSSPSCFDPDLDPDIRGAIAAGVTHLVGTRWAGRLLAKVYVEALVQRHAAALRVAVDLQQIRAALG